MNEKILTKNSAGQVSVKRKVWTGPVCDGYREVPIAPEEPCIVYKGSIQPVCTRSRLMIRDVLSNGPTLAQFGATV